MFAISTASRWAGRSSRTRPSSLWISKRFASRIRSTLKGVVPTDLERTGDFSQSLANLPDPSNPDTAQAGIYDPCAGNQGSRHACAAQSILDGANVIPADKIDPIGQAILNLYPHANIPGAVYPNPNWRKVIIGTDPGWQFDVKVDHQFTTNHRIGGRYSRHHDQSTAPTVIGNGDQGDGLIYLTNVQNGGVEYNWSITPTALWTSRFSVDRVHAPGISNNYPTLSDVGLSSGSCSQRTHAHADHQRR